MDFLLATHNTKKRDELQRILSPLGVRVLIAEDAGINLPDVEETGSTFEENASLKAHSGCEFSGMPCIGDDSGLAVDALGGAPGIYSARYAGDHGNDGKNIVKLLKELEGVPAGKRTARFVCAVCCAFPDGRSIEVSGTCEGQIGFAPSGKGGFGYDPVFFVGGKSFGELSSAEKDSLSHRGNALRLLCERLKAEIL